MLGRSPGDFCLGEIPEPGLSIMEGIDISSGFTAFVLGLSMQRRLEFLGFFLIGLILVGLLTYQWFVVEEIDRYDPRFTAQNLGVIINEADPLSVQIGNYYQARRKIPPENLIYVKFAGGKPALTAAEFAGIKREVDRQAHRQIQGFALTWAAPYRVDCMSITSAFAFGFDQKHCAEGCAAIAPNPYFNRPESSRPYGDYKVRPTMMLAAENFFQAQALINRGVAADGTRPTGTGYLLSTGDRARNRRAASFPLAQQVVSPQFDFDVEILRSDALLDKQDVMFYFTGVTRVEHLDTLKFLPGAIADHLTSFGGKLTEKSGQMSSLRWLEAGATGSYGTVVEPCNFPQKFPNAGLAMETYLNGATLLESYWQSVLWVGQGVFIGEPLARPFGDP